ncbi:MBL fold metallo-hydrolase [Actinoplanes couchii]|uniref:MBL fold metallo-hydrolase n=1 Tax=Actinoplanes couchii TaxID=403638 RepID=A0ABQ3XR44_9ACTN|nr:MBL fold metallo-hydrolase [Actinoplanes couchii]MDR6317415.1 glyoxylase-like metal-dependent hydrolase (beta-lactamase superfamily II) [Actinoplanes couchii]GID60948.1 MBL fold metallo-hydrolase [Actinoplanes couchii]
MSEVVPGLHMVGFPVGHAYLWCGPDGLTLIDSGVPGSAGAIAAAVERLGYRRSDLRRLLLTHFHEDHVGSAAEIAAWGDVTVCAHAADAPVIRGEVAGPVPRLAGWEEELMRQVKAGMPSRPPEPVRVDHELGDGDRIDLGGGVEAVVVAVPGHTPGSVAFHLPGQRVLLTGDAIARSPAGDVMLGTFNVDPVMAAASFRLQAQLDVDVACFGHGEPLIGNAGAQLRAAAPAG